MAELFVRVHVEIEDFFGVVERPPGYALKLSAGIENSSPVA